MGVLSLFYEKTRFRYPSNTNGKLDNKNKKIKKGTKALPTESCI
jgi:hypothetical protein